MLNKKTNRTTIKRIPKRANYDSDKINAVIDEAVIGHLAFKMADSVHSIPLPFWQYGGYLYFHCSIQSRLTRLVEQGQQVCISFTILDGLVFAKSALHHSMNYRSVVVYGQCESVLDRDEKFKSLERFMAVFDQKRWQDVRQPNRKELNATGMLRILLTEAVLKQRIGPAEDLKSDLKRDVWSGIIPVKHIHLTPIIDEIS